MSRGAVPSSTGAGSLERVRPGLAGGWPSAWYRAQTSRPGRPPGDAPPRGTLADVMGAAPAGVADPARARTVLDETVRSSSPRSATKAVPWSSAGVANRCGAPCLAMSVDVSRRVPATGRGRRDRASRSPWPGSPRLWDGNGLVVKVDIAGRIEAVRGEPPRLPADLRQPGLRALYLSRRGRTHPPTGKVIWAIWCGGCEPHLLEAGNRWATM